MNKQQIITILIWAEKYMAEYMMGNSELLAKLVCERLELPANQWKQVKNTIEIGLGYKEYTGDDMSYSDMADEVLFLIGG